MGSRRSHLAYVRTTTYVCMYGRAPMHQVQKGSARCEQWPTFLLFDRCHKLAAVHHKVGS